MPESLEFPMPLLLHRDWRNIVLATQREEIPPGHRRRCHHVAGELTARFPESMAKSLRLAAKSRTFPGGLTVRKYERNSS